MSSPSLSSEEKMDRAHKRLSELGDPRLVAHLLAHGFAIADPTIGDTEASSPHETLNFLEGIFRDSINAVATVAPKVRITTTEEAVTAGDHSVPLLISRPHGSENVTLPCVVHLHGGAMAVLDARIEGYVSWRDNLAAQDLVVIGVDFRNSAGIRGPHPYPAGLNDCVAALEWTFRNKRRLNISSIILQGESGGGNLVLATALKTKDSACRPDGVYAMCPFICGKYDDQARSLYPSLNENDLIMQAVAASKPFVQAYGGPFDDPCAWPLAATTEHLQGMPPCVISVNELDIHRDEGLAFYRKLLSAGCTAQGKIIAGTVHAGDCWLKIAPDLADAALTSIAAFCRSLVVDATTKAIP